MPREREHVLLFSDWTDLDPEHIYATLKLQSDYYNFSKRTVGDFVRDVRDARLRARRSPTAACGARMRMNPTDLADVCGYAYTYLTERRDAGRQLDRRRSRRASACACASSTARR